MERTGAGRRGLKKFVLIAVAVGIVPWAAGAQVDQRSVGDSVVHALADTASVTVWERDSLAAQVPFGPGEEFRYKVKLGPINAGEAHMSVLGVEMVRGFPTYHLQMGMKGSVLFGALSIDDDYQSWLDTRALMSRRYVRDIHEVNHKDFRQYEFFPEELYWERADKEEWGDLPTSMPLDDIAFVYFIRSLPLVVGETYTLSQYFKESGNPVVIKVLRKEVREVPAGTFNTIVVQPIIRTSGLFGEGGEAEMYFTDDDKRQLVYMYAKMPVVGSLTLHLEEATDGTLIHTGGPEAQR